MVGVLMAMVAVIAAQSSAGANWRAIAVSDVNAAYREFADNHPGMQNPNDPRFSARLRAARDAALKVADRASDESAYRRALDIFTDGLADGHAVVIGFGDDPGKPVWPGFIGAWRGNRELVFHTESRSPAPAGSVILSCDGRSMAQLMRANFHGVFFRPAEAGQWWTVGPLLFIGRSPATAAQPRRCKFRTPGGSIRNSTLHWTPPPDSAFPLIGEAMAGERLKIGLTEPRSGIYLIGLPTFSPDDAGVRAFNATYAEVDRRRADLRKARAIVLDLRFNNGGSSNWALDLARHLWGKDAVDARMDDYFRNVRIWWRASPGNIASMAAREATIRHNGQLKAADHEHRVAEGMRAALAAGRPYYVEDANDENPWKGPIPATDLRTPVYVITWGGCMSACLDAIDIFKRFATVKLIGSPTSADSDYLDIRRLVLPSGKGQMTIPLKVWVKRPRHSGEVYRPDIPMNQLDWSTTAFLERIDDDLSGSVKLSSGSATKALPRTAATGSSSRRRAGAVRRASCCRS